MISLFTRYTSLPGTGLSITGTGTVLSAISKEGSTAHLTGLLVSRCTLRQVSVLVPIDHTAVVTAEGFAFAAGGLIQGSTTLPAVGEPRCNMLNHDRLNFLLSADTRQKGFDGAQGQSCGLCDC
nr:hypothetical protein [Clostridia bacterium]